MNKKEQQVRQNFFNEISNYQYIQENGRLILEKFCSYLHLCFGFDNILELSPRPNDIYMLLINIINEEFGEEEAKKKIQFQNIIDWKPELAITYPEKRMTLIHSAALVEVAHIWIYEIGHSLIGIPEPEEGKKYFSWASEDWLAVHTFINGFHNSFTAYLKKFDSERINENGYSIFEALHTSYAKNIDFDEAVIELKRRSFAHQAALKQILKSIEDSYYLEAITLEECLISNCLFNFLNATGGKLTNPPLHKLIFEILARQGSEHNYPRELIGKIDDWRKARNMAIHGFVSSASEDVENSLEKFKESAKSTAISGEEYCRAIISWYEGECVNFIQHEFPKENHQTLH